MLGRVFNDKNELQMVYSNYAQEEIFSVKIRSSNMEEDENLLSFNTEEVMLKYMVMIHHL